MCVYDGETEITAQHVLTAYRLYTVAIICGLQSLRDASFSSPHWAIWGYNEVPNTLATWTRILCERKR